MPTLTNHCGAAPGPRRVPAGYRHSAPLQPPADYYVTRKELREAIEFLLAGHEKIDGLEELVLSFEKTLGEVESTVTAVESGLTEVEGNLTEVEDAVDVVEGTALYNTETIARLLEIVTNPEAEAEAEGLQELAKSVGDLDSMTQAEKTDFIVKVIKYILAKEKIS